MNRTDQQIKQRFPFTWPLRRSPKHSEVTIPKALKQRPANTTLGDFGSLFPVKNVRWLLNSPVESPKRACIQKKKVSNKENIWIFLAQGGWIFFFKHNTSRYPSLKLTAKAPEKWWWEDDSAILLGFGLHWGPIPLPPWLPLDSSSGLCGVDDVVWKVNARIWTCIQWNSYLTKGHTSSCIRLSIGEIHHGLPKWFQRFFCYPSYVSIHVIKVNVRAPSVMLQRWRFAMGDSKGFQDVSQ